MPAAPQALVLTVDTPYVAAKARPSQVPPEVPLTPLVPGCSTRRTRVAGNAPDVTTADIGWLRELSGGLPVVVKGVVSGDDARACLDAGAAAAPPSWWSDRSDPSLSVVRTTVAR